VGQASDAKRLRELEAENAKLMHLLSRDNNQFQPYA
jgi:hypothetical protein